MKKILAILLALLCLASVACAEGSIIISGTDSAEVTLGDKISVEKVCDVTISSLTADEYAFTVAAFERPNDELVNSPAVKSELTGTQWNERARYKYDMNGDVNPYAMAYADCGFALKASAVEYKLLDLRLSVLNRMLLPMTVADKVQVKLVYDTDYEFEATYVRMETADTLGNPNEWLCEPEDLGMLVERTVHYVFEIPNAVLQIEAPLKAVITVSGEEYEFIIR